LNQLEKGRESLRVPLVVDKWTNYSVLLCLQWKYTEHLLVFARNWGTVTKDVSQYLVDSVCCYVYFTHGQENRTDCATESGNMLARLAKGLLFSLTTMLFVLILPILLAFLLVPSLPQDDRWFLKIAFTFLGPFSAVLWFITFSHLVLHRRAGYFKQAVVFFGSAGVIYLLLSSGVYHL
jgi:hypothetical protein